MITNEIQAVPKGEAAGRVERSKQGRSSVV